MYVAVRVKAELTQDDQYDQVLVMFRSASNISDLYQLNDSTFLHRFRHPFGAANQAEIPGTAERDAMADVAQMKKTVHICNLVFGVNIPDLNLRVHKRSSVSCL